MHLDETTITRAIIERYTAKLLASLDLDTAIVGGGPAGLVAAYKLADRGFRVALFERKLSLGGGMWGGGMMFNEIVVQEEGRRILDEVQVRAEPYGDGYYTADAIEAVSGLTYRAIRSGARIFNLVSVEDVVAREGRVSGVVINWTPVMLGKLHVDPLTVRARCVLDATGHDADVARIVEQKLEARLSTPSGRLEGERSLWADAGERATVENTREAYPGLIVAGMAATATFGSHRMGPVFGGMLLSGERAAQLIAEQLGPPEG
jgi:thiamine thiazole synthase